jgi:PhnB protein
MTVRLNPYLSFRDNARQALEFYHSVFGGELTTSTFADFHASEDPAEQDKVMHGHLVGTTGLVLMVSDTPDSMEHAPGTNSHAVSLSGSPADQAELRGYWERLSEDATAVTPLAAAPWGDTFGMCTDKFGITWLVNIASA